MPQPKCQSGYEPDELLVTPEMIEAGVSELLSSGLLIPSSEGSTAVLRVAVADVLAAAFGAVGAR